MQTVRKLSKHPVLLIFLSLSMLLFSCGKESIKPEITQLSGEDFMKAIYFLDGEAIDYIEPLQDLKLEVLFEGQEVELVRGHIDLLLDQIETRYPGTFHSFKLAMTSGDHILISEAITNNAHLIYEGIKEFNKSDEGFVSLIEQGQQPLAELMDTHFPSKLEDLTPREMKSVVKSESFKKDVSSYFKNFEQKINGRNSQVEDQMCSIIVGAAVLVVAAIAVAVIYAVVILNAVETANIVHFVWAKQEVVRSTLVKDQIIN